MRKLKDISVNFWGWNAGMIDMRVRFRILLHFPLPSSIGFGLLIGRISNVSGFSKLSTTVSSGLSQSITGNRYIVNIVHCVLNFIKRHTFMLLTIWSCWHRCGCRRSWNNEMNYLNCHMSSKTFSLNCYLLVDDGIFRGKSLTQ